MSTDSATRKQSQILNVPNILSMIRLFMAFIVVGVIPFSAYQLALVLFVVAASTDWIDGWWARKFDQVTQLGRIWRISGEHLGASGSCVAAGVPIWNRVGV